MYVDDQRLAEELWRRRCLLSTEKKLICVDVPIVDGDLPLVRSEIGRLRLAVSPQTGGCESDRDSALGERLPWGEHHTGPDHQDHDETLNRLAWESHGVLLDPVPAIALGVSQRAPAGWSHS